MPLRKRQDTGNWKGKHWLALCGELEGEAPARTVWRTRFGIGHGPVVRQTAKWSLLGRHWFPPEQSCRMAVRKVSSHFEYLDDRSRGLDVTWQPIRGDLTVHL